MWHVEAWGKEGECEHGMGGELWAWKERGSI